MKKVKSENVSDSKRLDDIENIINQLSCFSDTKKEESIIFEILSQMEGVVLSKSNEEAVLFLYSDKSGKCLFGVEGFMPSFRNIIKKPPTNKTNTEEVLSLRKNFLNFMVSISAIICNENKELKELFLELINQDK